MTGYLARVDFHHLIPLHPQEVRMALEVGLTISSWIGSGHWRRPDPFFFLILFSVAVDI